MSFRIITQLLKKWKFVDEQIRYGIILEGIWWCFCDRYGKDFEERDVHRNNTETNGKNTPPIKVRPSKDAGDETYRRKLGYSNIVELFSASIQDYSFFWKDRYITDTSIGLSGYEFINFVVLLGLFSWRVSYQLLDKTPEEAVRATISSKIDLKF